MNKNLIHVIMIMGLSLAVSGILLAGIDFFNDPKTEISIFSAIFGLSSIPIVIYGKTRKIDEVKA